MNSQVYCVDLPINGRLAIMARPRAGDWLEDEIAGWRSQGIGTVVSALEREEVCELGLEEEAGLCHTQGMGFVSFPIPDRGVPASVHDAITLAADIAIKLGAGEFVAVHCRAGIGRSSLIAACALVYSGVTPEAAFEAIGKARGLAVPDTDDQRQWVRDFIDAMANVRNRKA